MENSVIIPQALLTRQQWVGCTENKLPIDPHTGGLASVTDRTTWGSFEEALAMGPYCVGFVFTERDPFVFIDLDNKEGDPEVERYYQELIRWFDSYTERSNSGTGYHIIVQGKVPRGARMGNIEVYPSDRFCMWTSTIVDGRDVIHARQEQLDVFFPNMQESLRPVDALADKLRKEESLTDDQVLAIALHPDYEEEEGQYERWYYDGLEDGEDGSRADFALIGRLYDVCQNEEQATRIWLSSQLPHRAGFREKHGKPVRYIETTMGKLIRKKDAELNEVQDFGHLMLDPLPANPIQDLDWPPGPVGELARLIYRQSHRPIRQFSIAAALFGMSAIAGRSYFTPTGDGLALYQLVLGPSGCGKESPRQAWNMILRKVVASAKGTINEMAMQRIFQVFRGSGFQSSQAIRRVLAEQPVIGTYIGEIGAKVSNQRTGNSAVNTSLYPLLLDTYTQCGLHGYMGEENRADRAKTDGAVYAPTLSLIGDSTVEQLSNALDSGNFADGLMGRFLVTALGERELIPDAVNPPALQVPGAVIQMIHGVAFTGGAVMVPGAEPKGRVALIDVDAEEHCRLIDVKVTAARNAMRLDGVQHQFPGEDPNLLVMRARSKQTILRVATLLAAADNPGEPFITLKHVLWAESYYNYSAHVVRELLDSGVMEKSIEGNDIVIMKVIEGYFRKTVAERMLLPKMPKYATDDLVAGAIPHQVLCRMLRDRKSAFTIPAGRSFSEAVEQSCTSLIQEGRLESVQKAYLVGLSGATVKLSLLHS
mgnify:FL=1